MIPRNIALLILLAGAATAQDPPAAPAPAPAAPPATRRVAVIEFQQAVLATKEGRQAAAALKARFDPKKAEVQKRQAQLEAIQQRLQLASATISPQARAQMQDDYERGARKLQHDIDDLNAELQAEEDKIMREMAGKLAELIQQYAARNGFSMVLDVSNQQTPVLWAAAENNITADIVEQYDAAHPVKTATASK